MRKMKARTMSEVAALYQVSKDEFERQVQGYAALRNELKRQGFFGNYLYPKHQNIVFRYLGEPELKAEWGKEKDKQVGLKSE